MAIITQHNKDTGTTYVYESISYWDAEKQQSRSKRRLLGKVDPQTGEIIPTGKRGRKKKEAVPAEQAPAAQDLNNPHQFFFSSDERIQVPCCGTRGQIYGKLVQDLCLALSMLFPGTDGFALFF